MHRVITYTEINGLRFGGEKVELETMAGQNIVESKNRLGEIEIDFNGVVYRYSDVGLVEATFAASGMSVSINNEVVVNVWDWMQDMDNDCVVCLGFLVSEKYGLAMDEDEKYGWLSVFHEGRWDKHIAKGLRLVSSVKCKSRRPS